MPKKKQETPAISMMTHTILLQPKAETSDEALASLLKGVHSLQKSIPCLISDTMPKAVERQDGA